MIESIKQHVSDKLRGELPGESAHVEMAPIKRPLPEEARTWKETRYSGVLVLLYPHEERLHTALMMRPEYDGVHSRQVSFPGGKREEGDADIIQTALREAHEELGIRPEEVEVLGNLSELYIPPSKALVTPVVGFAETRPNFIKDDVEVDEIIEADLMNLLGEESFGKVEIVRASYILKEVPAILFNGYTIWGATAMMLNEVKWLLEDFK
jgi:8-oxo-dGTP pyrophosphatase MutT (NUDIX family)